MSANLTNANNPIFYRTNASLEKERKYKGLLNPPIIDAHPYHLYQENKLKPNTTRLQAFSGTVEATALNQAFLSQENIDYLQDQIRFEVYKRSNHENIIGRQSDIELLIIMRSIYFQYSKNQQSNIKMQIKELNDLVIQETVPKIMSGIEQYKYYLVDASRLPMPLSHGESTNSAGRKQLPSVTKIWS